MLVDYHVHGMGHGTYNHSRDDLAAFIQTGLSVNLKEIGFAEHDWYLNKINWTNLSSIQADFPQVTVRIGLEVDYFPEREKEIAGWLMKHPFDYVIGSVHHIGDWMFDHPDCVAEYQRWDIDDLYQVYFNLVARLVQSRLFDVIGHLDLIKIFGYRPQRSQPDRMIEPVLKIIRQAGLVVELNTAGRYRPVAEVYPSEKILTRCWEHDIPITLSSDAHEPEQVGRDIGWARELARRIGYRQIATFHQRQIDFVSL